MKKSGNVSAAHLPAFSGAKPLAGCLLSFAPYASAQPAGNRFPPLLLLGAPVVPLLHGLPRWVLKLFLAPLFRLRALRKFVHFLVQPAVAWLGMNLVFLGWHLPAAYDFALERERWHDFEHICFFVTSLLFSWVVLTPWPGRRQKK